MNVPAAAEWTFGNGGFAKLYGDRLAASSLLDCSVPTRWVFVYMLARADSMGRFRCATIPGLAREAAVSLGEAERAVAELEAPDPSSTSPEHEGRRLLRIPGGWQITNYERYREYRTPEQARAAARQRKHRTGQRDMSHDVTARHAQTSDVRRQTADGRGTERTATEEPSAGAEGFALTATPAGAGSSTARTTTTRATTAKTTAVEPSCDVLTVLEARTATLGGHAGATSPKVKAVERFLRSGFTVNDARHVFEAIRDAEDRPADGTMASFCAHRNRSFEYSVRPTTAQAILDELAAPARVRPSCRESVIDVEARVLQDFVRDHTRGDAA